MARPTECDVDTVGEQCGQRRPNTAVKAALEVTLLGEGPGQRQHPGGGAAVRHDVDDQGPVGATQLDDGLVVQGEELPGPGQQLLPLRRE